MQRGERSHPDNKDQFCLFNGLPWIIPANRGKANPPSHAPVMQNMAQIHYLDCLGTWFGFRARSSNQTGSVGILRLWDVSSFVHQNTLRQQDRIADIFEEAMNN